MHRTWQEAAQVALQQPGQTDWLVPAFRELGAWLYRGRFGKGLPVLVWE